MGLAGRDLANPEWPWEITRPGSAFREPLAAATGCCYGLQVRGLSGAYGGSGPGEAVAPGESFDVRNPTAPPMESGSCDGSSRPDVVGDGLLGRSTGGKLETPCEWGELLVLQWIASRAFADVYLARVNDPNVVRVYGAGRLGDQIGMRMELVQGRTLQEMLRTGQVPSPSVRLCSMGAIGFTRSVISAGLGLTDVAWEGHGPCKR
jgi:hypothetical protein